MVDYQDLDCVMAQQYALLLPIQLTLAGLASQPNQPATRPNSQQIPYLFCK